MTFRLTTNALMNVLVTTLFDLRVYQFYLLHVNKGSVRCFPMVPLVILPMAPLVASGNIGLPMVPLGEPVVPLALSLVSMFLPMVPLVEP